MQAQQRSGELSFSLEDVTRILRRRKNWFLIPTGVGIVLALVLALGLPPTYEATSTVIVQPPGIPDSLVETRSSRRADDSGDKPVGNSQCDSEASKCRTR